MLGRLPRGLTGTQRKEREGAADGGAKDEADDEGNGVHGGIVWGPCRTVHLRARDAPVQNVPARMADAYNWYVQDFMTKVAERRAERAAQIAAEAARRSWASIALGAAGSALVLLLSFLALPLLIQIERNTRPKALT